MPRRPMITPLSRSGRQRPRAALIGLAALISLVALVLVMAAPAAAWEPEAAWEAAGAWDPVTASQPPFVLEPPSVVFEGFELSEFRGAGSVASALRRCGTKATTESDTPIEFKGIAVQGPRGRDAAPGPLAAELRSRIDRIDVSAGVAADPERIQEGPSRWTGRIGLSNDRETGSESLEVRTMLAPSDEASIVGVTVGPRLERRLRKGATIFIDGQAEARALRTADTGWWSVPGVADGSLTMLGLTARTGIMR